MTALEEHQFEIVSSPDAQDGFVFGIGAEVSVNGDGFDPGESTWLVQDTANSRRGNTRFGRDVKAAPIWSWESHTDRGAVDEAIDTLLRFSDAWGPEELVLEPGYVMALRYRIAGRDRRIFGRPRDFAAPPTNLILTGMVPITHSFQAVDANTYDDIEQSVEIAYASSASQGGFILPTPMPILTLPPGPGSGGSQLSIGGNRRTYPIIRFNGPWTNPVFSTSDWTLSWNGTIPAGQWVEIDTRPWVSSVVTQSGASAAAGMSKRSFLENYFFRPNTQPQVSLGGISPGGGRATVRWRNAWSFL